MLCKMQSSLSGFSAALFLLRDSPPVVGLDDVCCCAELGYNDVASVARSLTLVIDKMMTG